MHQEDAISFLVDWIRGGCTTTYPNYGYDFTPENACRACAGGSGDGASVFPVISAAIWELCRRGILRPGVSRMGGQEVDGGGFTVTPFGRTWLNDESRHVFVPTEPERFGKLLEPFRERFGPGFHARAQEAIRCYGAHAYLACCAMCGAAAESILLAAAIAKFGDEARVLADYSSKGGRGRIENATAGKEDHVTKRNLQGLTGLLKYWRDESAHGRSSSITDLEAHASLALLLQYAKYVDGSWAELIANRAASDG